MTTNLSLLPSFSLLPVLLLFFAAASAVTVPGDVAALAALKASISPESINSWSCLASWNFSSDPCRPRFPSHFTCGISCNADSTRITAIALDPAGYSGTLPSLLSKLTLLAHLDLIDNAFHGPIPSSVFSSLPNLQTLMLSSNSFSGAIPYSLSRLASLQTLDLSHNALTGPVPQFLSSLSNLRTLDLSFNRLSDDLPATMPPNLVQLAVRGNSLSGFLKRSTFEPLRWLEVVELAANRFQGTLEGWFFLLPSLQQLDLANNSLTRMEVWGTTGDQLVAVDLGFNRIEGRLPVALAGFPSLAALSLRYNRFRGAIPWEYYSAKKGAPFRRLYLDGNFLNGSVPNGFFAGDMTGSFGDNCLETCPASAALCSPLQKPEWICKKVYRSK